MKITNKTAFRDYEVVDRMEAGIQLVGSEVKALRAGHADLSGSHARIKGSEAFLIGAKIFPYQYARPDGYQESRTRKLLLHKSEIIRIKAKIEGTKLTLIPLSLYTDKRYIKVELAIGKGKKAYEKKQAIKKRDLDRDLAGSY